MSTKTYQTTNLSRLIIYMLLGLVVLTVGGSLSLLWTRQQIERTAEATQTLEREIAREERRLRYLDTKIAEIHQPNYLHRQIDQHDLDLQPPTGDQIVYLEVERKQEYYAEAKREDERETDREPYRRTFDLAVMESVRGAD